MGNKNAAMLQPHAHRPDLSAIVQTAFGTPSLYDEELTDLEDAFRLWRFRHVTTVERVTGFKRCTGGTGGLICLRKMLDVMLFPKIWTLRTQL